MFQFYLGIYSFYFLLYFRFLIFTIIILPTFGFTSIGAVMQAFTGQINHMQPNATGQTDVEADSFPWECIFVPDSGASFVNYVITASMIGCGFELIRLFDVLIYILRVCYSRSKAETAFIQNVLVVSEFRFGEQYAKLLMILCMVVMYSMLCPLITPFGVLYFIIKYYTDRQNLMYGYKPSKINKKVHSTAIHYVVLCALILQFVMMTFFLIRNGLNNLRLISSFSIGVFLLSLNIYSAQLWSHACEKLSPIDYLECNYIQEDDVEDEKKKNDIYLPITLMSLEEKTKYREYVAFKENKSSRNAQGYGALGSTFNKALLFSNKIKRPFKQNNHDE